MILLRQSTLTLRPTLDQSDPNQPEDERIKERLRKFGQAFMVYRDLIEKNKPFYTQPVYEKLYKVLDLCHTEAIEYQYKYDRKWKEYWEVQRKNHEAISAAIDESCEAIRKRIENLSVLPP